MKRTMVWLAGSLMLLTLALGGCGGPRACLVIPAQVDLLEGRRDEALSRLEDKARQVDRLRASLERSQERYQQLLAQKALLDSLGVEATR
jgi:hypothetical protein